MAHVYRSRARLPTTRETQVIEWASEDQQFAFQYPPGAPLCLSGGFGAAKTAAAVMKIHRVCDMFPGYRWVVARNRWNDLQKTTMQTFFKWCPPEAYRISGRRNDQDKIFQYNNGSLVYWLHLDNLEESLNVIKGLEVNGFLGDQAEELDEEVFERIKGRLGRWDGVTVPDAIVRYAEAKYGVPWPWRNKKTGKLEAPVYNLLTCNPDTEVHWLYRRFHPDSPDHHENRGTVENPRPSYKEQGYFMLFMDSTKNKFLSDQNIEEMLSNDDSFIRRYVRGLWGIPEGRIHDVSKLSLIEGRDELVQYLTQTCTLMRVLDHGDSAPTACLWIAIDPQGNWFVYREYYMPNKLISDHRKNITGMSLGESYSWNISDPQIHLATMQKHNDRWSVAQEYADRVNLPAVTALDWEKGDNDEMSTRNRINEMLKIDKERVHPFLNVKGSPRLFFLTKNADFPNGCDHTLRELRSQRKEKIGTINGRPIFSDDREKGIDDHTYDCVRYGVASQAVSSITPVITESQFTLNSTRKNLVNRQGKKGLMVMAQRAQLAATLGAKMKRGF